MTSPRTNGCHGGPGLGQIGVHIAAGELAMCGAATGGARFGDAVDPECPPVVRSRSKATRYQRLLSATSLTGSTCRVVVRPCESA